MIPTCHAQIRPLGHAGGRMMVAGLLDFGRDIQPLVLDSDDDRGAAASFCWR